MHELRLGLVLISLAVPATVARDPLSTARDLATPSAWEVIPSDGVTAALHASDTDGVLRLEFDFSRGAGFVVVRRPVDLVLPENYRFTFAVRGDAPPNNLEFKLVDPGGENVWWVNRRAFVFADQWQTLSYRARHFRFAWGPSGGAPLERVGAIEFAVAAATGGRGVIELRDLAFEPLPPAPATTGPLRLRPSSTATDTAGDALTPAEDGKIDWTSAADDVTPVLDVDLGGPRAVGGLALQWDAADFPTSWTVSVTSDDGSTPPVVRGTTDRGGWSYVTLGDVEATTLRITAERTARGRGVRLHALRLLPPTFADSPNAMYRVIAADAPRGHFPRYFLGKQPYWTVVGVAGDEQEGLFDTDGAVEAGRPGFRLEPFLWLDGRLVTWADVQPRLALDEDYLPIPTVTWPVENIELAIAPLAVGATDRSGLLVRYHLTNHGDRARRLALLIAVRPMQVLPPWQDLNITGGATPVGELAVVDNRVTVDGQPRVETWPAPAAAGVTAFGRGDIAADLAVGRLPAATQVSDPAELASGALRYNLELAAGADAAVVLWVPLHANATLPDPSPAADAAAFDAHRQRVAETWAAELNHAELRLPPAAAHLANTFRTMQAYVLINADGPAIQPGSRTYERSWIRDGALTCTALLYTGHTAQVRAYLDWYAPYQFDNGKVPCVVDRRGGDPVPEHDSTGQLIYLLQRYYRFTGDRAMLARHLPRVAAGIDYLDSLRQQRLTDEYRDGPPEKRACYGLVTESISHEGYSAKPMHSYWDSFFVLRGLRDARAIATTLERPDLAERFAAFHDEYHAAVAASVRLAMRNHGIGYVPGCAELGDFDATSTSIAVYPCAADDAVPADALAATFERYWTFFVERRDGRLEWRDYTPYEIRIVNTLLRLGQVDRAHALLDFFLSDQRPPQWNQWAEVTHADRTAPRFVGDSPHTWVGSEFLTAVRSLFVYERERDDSLVVGAGLRPEWLRDPAGVGVADLPTEYGTVSYQARVADGRFMLTLEATGRVPPGGFVVRAPESLSASAVTVDGQPAPAAPGGGWLVRALTGRLEARIDSPARLGPGGP
jgi:hypothetical protein